LTILCFESEHPFSWSNEQVKNSIVVATSVLKAVSVVPPGSNNMDVRRENMDVRWVGFHPLCCRSNYRDLSVHMETEREQSSAYRVLHALGPFI
jgi:hypothetical protein